MDQKSPNSIQFDTEDQAMDPTKGCAYRSSVQGSWTLKDTYSIFILTKLKILWWKQVQNSAHQAWSESYVEL